MSDTQTHTAPSAPKAVVAPANDLPASYLGDEDALNLLPTLAVERLLDNGRRIAMTGNDDVEPVVKLFAPDAGSTWLLVSIDPDEPDLAYGLCDLGLGCAEIGSVSIAEIKSIRGAVGLPPERDLHFEAEGTLGWYADRSRVSGSIRA